MNNATAPVSAAPPATSETIRSSEAAHFGALAADWWDPKGSSAMLHRLNPVRLAFLREAVDQHFGADSHALKPLAGRKALDVGCGAGLLSEPLARLGAAVTGIDAAPENAAAATAHAAAMGLLGTGSEGGTVTYRAGEIGTIAPTGFDLVCAMEVIEHVGNKGAFVASLAQALAPGGLMVISTPNRTARSRLLLVEAAERIGHVARGTHHWDDFITPEELAELLAAAGLVMGTPRGIGWSPLAGLHLSQDLALNYIVTATRK
jgi:2-polyprenyl-6-hydroxyphenyl methylase / 3-demethylubiquinone-9 3-methyltransferase